MMEQTQNENGLVFYNAKEAAKLLGVDYRTFLDSIKRGQINCIHVGKRYLISNLTLNMMAGKDMTPEERKIAEIARTLTLRPELAQLMREAADLPTDIAPKIIGDLVYQLRKQAARIRPNPKG